MPLPLISRDDLTEAPWPSLDRLVAWEHGYTPARVAGETLSRYRDRLVDLLLVAWRSADAVGGAL